MRLPSGRRSSVTGPSRRPRSGERPSTPIHCGHLTAARRSCGSCVHRGVGAMQPDAGRIHAFRALETFCRSCRRLVARCRRRDQLRSRIVSQSDSGVVRIAPANVEMRGTALLALSH
jgi:hypothetical protein